MNHLQQYPFFSSGSICQVSAHSKKYLSYCGRLKGQRQEIAFPSPSCCNWKDSRFSGKLHATAFIALVAHTQFPTTATVRRLLPHQYTDRGAVRSFFESEIPTYAIWDVAYALLGPFGTSTCLFLYGEGKKAFERLQREMDQGFSWRVNLRVDGWEYGPWWDALPHGQGVLQIHPTSDMGIMAITFREDLYTMSKPRIEFSSFFERVDWLIDSVIVPAAVRLLCSVDL